MSQQDKTATQSVKASLHDSGYRVGHIHTYQHFTPIEFSSSPMAKWPVENKEALKLFFKQVKPMIIYILRDPLSRLRSSYFQSYHDDLIQFAGFKKEDTPVFRQDAENLFDDFTQRVKNDTLPGRVDSLSELEDIAGVDVFNHLQQKPGFFYFKLDYLNIYLLDFNRLLSGREHYLSSCLNTKIARFLDRNLTSGKDYQEKYTSFKEMKPAQEVRDIINQRYGKVEALVAKMRND